MYCTKGVRFTGVASALIAISLATLSLPAQATLQGKYLVRSASNDGKCLSASTIGALQYVSFAACDPTAVNQKWRITEVGTNNGYGVNTLALHDSAGNQFCLTTANYNLSQPYIEPCEAGRARQQWVSAYPINYGKSYGDSYRLRWMKVDNTCLDNEGPDANYPDLRTCWSGDPASRIKSQWYFDSLK
jgi:hypothetical protein